MGLRHEGKPLAFKFWWRFGLDWSVVQGDDPRFSSSGSSSADSIGQNILIVDCFSSLFARVQFLTNNFTLPALTIARLYKCRWQIELFFKWIKQHLLIKAFYGTSDNAVKIQVWIAISVYCEPTTHRSVLRGSFPPQHHPHDCQPGPPLSTPVGGGSCPPCPSEAWLASDDRGRRPATQRLFSLYFARFPAWSPAPTHGCSQRRRHSRRTASASQTVVTSATNRSDAMAVRDDEN